MRSLLTLGIALILLTAAAAAGISYWVYSSVTTPVGHDRNSTYIKIDRGSTPSQIVGKLASEGIISSPTAVDLYLRVAGDPSKLQAGEYQFASPITAIQVLKQLEKGEERTIKITIPEGFTRFDIAKRISEKLLPEYTSDEKTILALMDDTSMIRDIAPEAKDLEGYMYPSTYSIPRDARAADVLKLLVDQFRKFWKPEWTEKARSLGRTPHQIVTIASLIETETAVENERPIVAGIINNRLSRNIPLGIDQTNVYIAKMLGKWDGTIHKSDLEVDSPYNTRTKIGLPPGPISSVTESSIRAALEPQSNNYIFYVRNVDLNDGSHWFYATASEFEKGKARYQQWLESERKAKRSTGDQ